MFAILKQCSHLQRVFKEGYTYSSYISKCIFILLNNEKEYIQNKNQVYKKKPVLPGNSSSDCATG